MLTGRHSRGAMPFSQNGKEPNLAETKRGGCGKIYAAIRRTSFPFMPVVLKIDARRKVVYSAFYGRIDDAEVAGHRSAIASDPDFSPDFNEIIDFTAVTDASLSESTLAGMASSPSLFHESVLHIVVAPADLLFQLASKYKGLARFSRPNVMVVRSRDEAYQLLADGVKKP